MNIIIYFDDYMESIKAKHIVNRMRNLDPLDWLEYAPYMIGISDKVYKILKISKIKFHEKI